MMLFQWEVGLPPHFPSRTPWGTGSLRWTTFTTLDGSGLSPFTALSYSTLCSGEHCYLSVHYLASYTTYMFVCNRLVTKVFYGQIIGYGRSVDDHKVAWGNGQLHDINWSALDHASRAPQLMSCNCYNYVDQQCLFKHTHMHTFALTHTCTHAHSHTHILTNTHTYVHITGVV